MKLSVFTSKSIQFIFIIVFFILFSCKNTENPVPYIYVDFIVDLHDPSFIDLNAIGNSVIVEKEGVKGIIIYRKSLDEFIALDRTCTFDPNASYGKVAIKGFYAIDTVCNSKFSIPFSGSVASGPAKYPLKEYRVEFNVNTSVLHIFN